MVNVLRVLVLICGALFCGCTTNDFRFVVSGRTDAREGGISDQQYSKLVGVCSRVAVRHGLQKVEGRNVQPGGSLFAVPKALHNFVGPSIYVAPRGLASEGLVVVSGEGSDTLGRDRDVLIADLQHELRHEFGTAKVQGAPYHWTDF